MALHAKLLKHNILRVSKLKKLSHTTQAIERNLDRNAAVSVANLKATAANQNRDIGQAKQDPDLWSGPITLLEGPSSLSTQSSPFGLQEILALPAQQNSPVTAPYKGASCFPGQPSLGVVSAEKLQDREKSLAALLFPQDCLSLVVKPVSYTTDDIIACPVDHEKQRNTDADLHLCTVSLASEKQPDRSTGLNPNDISLVGERQSVLWDNLFADNILGLLSNTDVKARATEPTLAVKDNTRHFRRHSVSVSNPASRVEEEKDSQTVLCGVTSQTQRSVLCSAGSDKPAGGGGEGPNLDVLRAVESHFLETLPSFFKSRLDYQIYHPNVVLENNFWGKNEVTVGINQYAMQMMKLRALTHLKFAHVHMEVISSACIPEEGVIRIEWRVIGISQLKALRFWRYTAWSYNKTFKEDAEWIGGISTLHVNKDGQVTKHSIDRVTPDEGQAVKSMSLAAKLALLVGVSLPKPGLSDCSSLLCKR